MKRAALGGVLALLAFLVGAAPAALAHTELILSTPDDGAHLATAPDEILLTFSEDLLPDSVVVSVVDSSGFVVRVLDLTVDGSDVALSFPPGMSGSDFDVNYRVVSQDGHPVSGTISFTVDTPVGDASSPVAATSAPITTTTDEASGAGTGQSSSMAPIAAISVGLGVGIAVGFFFILNRRRSNRSAA